MISTEIRKHIARPEFVRRRRPCKNCRHRAERLRRNQRKCNVHARQRLQQNHAQSDALNGIEQAEPEPE